MLHRDDVSRTARLVAACRALDAAAGDGRRLISMPDRHAADLAGGEALAHAAALPALVTGVGLRTRWLDEHLAAFVAAHAAASPQIVLVGAGLDTRAHRLGLDATFFELDLPGMLAFKRAALGDPPRGHALAADLRHERVAALLAAHPAYHRDAPTCLVWEGVSYYLPAAAVGAALDDFRGLLDERGRLLFDFVAARWLVAANRASPGVVAQVARWGEPMIFGFDDVRATAAEHGLEIVEEIGTEELLPRYGLPPAGERWYAGRMAAARRRPGR